MLVENIDTENKNLLLANKDILNILLKDRTTNRNIIWATDMYAKYGKKYQFNKPITLELISGYNENFIKPRIEKQLYEQQLRSKEKAEVFTPSWVCNSQNNLIDNAWFGFENMFNYEIKEGWVTNNNKIIFNGKGNRTWEEYVKLKRLEIACGEAPYIVSRYDTVNGLHINITDRIGLLDRKLRVISENIDEEKVWIEWCMEALKSVYAYDFQGDNVLLARKNILYSILEFYKDKFKKELSLEYILEFAKIISWNIWQMDGMKFVVPGTCKNYRNIEYTLFGEVIEFTECEGCIKNDMKKHNGIYCKIRDWNKKNSIKFIDLL